ncbi:transglutaminase domain-containing protein, partial [Methanobrevibacter sp.]|uniref:transglutaminase domain-containing protein n=1 Tax=Methanobrevibacter sp. TaxID=66852 RepID=UPI0026DF561C
VGNIIYSELVDAASRILTFYKNNDKYMPNYVTVKYGSSSSSSASVSAGGMNVKNTLSDVSAYLKSTTNCQVGNSAIKTLVNSLTSGLTTAKAKATAIYNYVRDSISYSFYYDTKYGATGTLSAKAGNCVDQAHLLAAMFRTAGLATRYEHGTCKFSSGSTYGHVWTQVLIDNVWVVADPTSSRNSLGVVNNWYTSSYTHHAYYASLPF